MALLSIGEILDLGNSANMSSYIPYSALDYDPTGAISGISGSAIAGGVDSSVVSSIVSSMVSSKADQSALEDCCSSMSSVVSSIQNDVSGISSYVSGLTGEYLEKSASSLFAPSADYAYNSSLSSYLYASASSLFQSAGNYQTAGDYAYNSSVSAKLDASASSEFYLTSNPSGFITGVDLDGYATTAYVDSSVSSKLDSSASSSFYTVDNPSGFITGVDLDGYATTIYVDSSVSGKMDKSESSSFYPMTGNPSGFLTSVDLSDYATTAYVDSSVSGKLDTSAQVVTSILKFVHYDQSSVCQINEMPILAASAEMGTDGRYISSLASKSSLSSYYPTSNPSGFITDSTLVNYATTAYVDSSVSGKMDKTESSSFYPMYSNPSGYLTAVDINECVISAGSGIDFRVDGQGVYIDVNFYNAFTSLSAWATAQGWTGV